MSPGGKNKCDLVPSCPLGALPWQSPPGTSPCAPVCQQRLLLSCGSSLRHEVASSRSHCRHCWKAHCLCRWSATSPVLPPHGSSSNSMRGELSQAGVLARDNAEERCRQRGSPQHHHYTLLGVPAPMWRMYLFTNMSQSHPRYWEIGRALDFRRPMKSFRGGFLLTLQSPAACYSFRASPPVSVSFHTFWMGLTKSVIAQSGLNR